MLEIWNDSSVLPPPVLTFPCKCTFDTNGLEYVCNEIIRVLSKQSPLHQEGAIISRLIYKYDKKFRNDIGYRSLKKVNTALRKYLAIHFLKDVESFSSILPSDSDDLYLPSRQMLEYVLVRLQTFSKIMLRTYVCSKQAAIFYLDRIKRGESHWMSLMPFAALSRVWSISSVLISHSCNWYNSLLKYHPKLQPKGIPFLPKEYNLPTDLGKWLDIKNLDELGKYEWAENKSIKVLPILGDIEDVDGAFDIFKYVTEINDEKEIVQETPIAETEQENIISMEAHQKVTSQKMDHGEVVSRDSFIKANKEPHSDLGQPVSRQEIKVTSQLQNLKMFKNINSEVQENLKDHCMEKVTSSGTLKKFIKKEDKYRNEESSDALTSHLSFMQWQALRAALSKLCDMVANNRKIQRKFEKIWKEKCLDYL